MTFTTQELIAEADQIAARTMRRLQHCRRCLVQGQHQSLDVSGLEANAERAERELQRIDLYRALLNSGLDVHALMPEYVAARWSREPERRWPARFED